MACVIMLTRLYRDKFEMRSILTLRACTRGGAAGLSVCRRRRHENRQISSSGHLCVLWAQPIGRCRWGIAFCALWVAGGCLLALSIVHFRFGMPVVYWPRPLFGHNSVLMRPRMLKLGVGGGSSGHKTRRVLLYTALATVATERAGYVLYGALVQ